MLTGFAFLYSAVSCRAVHCSQGITVVSVTLNRDGTTGLTRQQFPLGMEVNKNRYQFYYEG